MPIPISVTNPNGKGLVAAIPSELPTSGPFARNAAAVAQNGHSEPTPDTQVVADTPMREPTNTDAAVVIDHLNFSYPDLGMLLIIQSLILLLHHNLFITMCYPITYNSAILYSRRPSSSQPPTSCSGHDSNPSPRSSLPFNRPQWCRKNQSP